MPQHNIDINDTSDIEYGIGDVDRDSADEIVRVVAHINEDQPSPEFSFVVCHDCDKQGYAACCYAIELEKATPKTWTTVIVCRDCADRDDPLTGAGPADLDHPLARSPHSVNTETERTETGNGGRSDE